MMEEKQSTASIQLELNGESMQSGAANLQELLTEVGLESKAGIAIAIAQRVIPRKDWTSRRLQPGDQITVIKAAAGG